MLGGGRPLDVNGLTNWKLAPTPLHHAPGSTHLRDVRCGNRLRPVRDSCQSLSQLRIGKLRDLVEVPLYDPRKACNQQLGFAQVVGILFADRFRLMGRVGLSPALDPLHPTELGSVCQATPKPPVQPQISLDDEVGQIVRQGAREGIAGNTKPNAVPLNDGRVAMCINTGYSDFHMRSLDLPLRTDEPTAHRDRAIFGIPLKLLAGFLRLLGQYLPKK